MTTEWKMSQTEAKQKRSKGRRNRNYDKIILNILKYKNKINDKNIQLK